MLPGHVNFSAFCCSFFCEPPLFLAASFLARFSCAFALALPRTIARQGGGGKGEGAHGRAAQRRAARAQQAPSLSSCSRPPSLHLGCRECGATRRELVPVRRTRGASTGSEVRAQALLCDAAAAAPADAVDAQCPRTTGAPTAFTACRAAVTAALAGARPASRTPTRSAPPSTRCVRTAARQARRAQPMANARMGAAGADKCILAARGSLR